MATILICHGAWSAGSNWQRPRRLLQQLGHEVFTPTYTGLGERAAQAAPYVDLDMHIGDIVSLIDAEDLREIALVGHSYGGMVATGVVDRCRSRISRVIYLDAFVPRNGQCLFDLLPAGMRAQRAAAAREKGDGWLVPPPPSPPDTSPDDVAWISQRQRWQPLGTFTQPIKLRHPEIDLPRTYIYCKRTGPDDRFRPFAERAISEGWRYYEIDASHSPHVTAPTELVQLLQQVVE